MRAPFRISRGAASNFDHRKRHFRCQPGVGAKPFICYGLYGSYTGTLRHG